MSKKPADPAETRHRAPGRRALRGWVPRTAAALCFVIGMLDVLTVVAPRMHRHVRWASSWLPGAFTSAAHAATVITGLLLIMLALALRRRKRRAWLAAVTLLGVSIVLHLIRGFYLGEALVASGLFAALIVYRDEFYAVGDPRTRWRALGVFVLLSTTSVALGLAFIAVNHRDLAGSYDFPTRLQHVVYGLVGVSGPVKFVHPRRADFLDDTLSALGLLTGLTTAYLLFRPAQPVPRLTAEDEKRIRELLARHGERDSLGYFALRRDKSVIWSPTGKACVSYRVVSGVMLASGDPLGDPEAWPGAIHAFIEEAERHAWVPAVMGCSELGGEVWTREAGMDALELGDEAIVEVGEFTLQGRAMRNVRQMVTRVRRQGYEVQVRRVVDIPPEELRQMRAQVARWRGSEVERGFSMALGRMGEPGDEDCVVATAYRDGVVRAILHFVPWGPDGLSLDLMRRDRDAQPGLNDFLIVKTIEAAPSLGVRRLSLNFAVFRSALERGERLGAGPITRAWRGILVFLSRWFQIESLYKFNAKFRPTWEPRFIVFPSTTDLPRIGIAALEAEAFIVWPRPGLQWLARLGHRGSRPDATARAEAQAR